MSVGGNLDDHERGDMSQGTEMQSPGLKAAVTKASNLQESTRLISSQEIELILIYSN